MCSTTTNNHQTVVKKEVFSVPPNTDPVPVVPKHALQEYLVKAYDSIAVAKLGSAPANKKRHVPISMIARVRAGDHHYAGKYDDEVHFAASLMKVAAMFAAYKLRKEAEDLGKAGFPSESAFITALKAQFKPADAVQAIQNAGAAVGQEPQYLKVLSVTGYGAGALKVEFNPTFFKTVAEDHVLFQAYQTIHAEQVAQGKVAKDKDNAVTTAALNKVSHMYRMIVPSNNFSAAECIHRLGYAYINVKLMNEGFFDKNTSKGIWLAADFIGGPKVEIDSDNDGKVGQATTSRQMVNLFQRLRLGTLVDPSSSTAMRNLLKAANSVDASWLIFDFDRENEVTRLFNVQGVKIGLANLKPNTPPMGPDVYSEGSLLRWKGDATALTNRGLSGEIAVCWTNLQAKNVAAHFDGIAEVIETTFSNFLKQDPP